MSAIETTLEIKEEEKIGERKSREFKKWRCQKEIRENNRKKIIKENNTQMMWSWKVLPRTQTKEGHMPFDNQHKFLTSSGQKSSHPPIRMKLYVWELCILGHCSFFIDEVYITPSLFSDSLLPTFGLLLSLKCIQAPLMSLVLNQSVQIQCPIYPR